MAAVASAPISDTSAARGGKGRARGGRPRTDRPRDGPGAGKPAPSSSSAAGAEQGKPAAGKGGASSSTLTPAEKAEAAEKFRARYAKELAAIEATHQAQVALKQRRAAIEQRMQALRAPTDEARKRRVEIRTSLKEIYERREALVQASKQRASRIESRKKQYEAKKAELDLISSGLPYRQYWNDDFVERNMSIIDEQKQELQLAFERRQLSTVEERKMVKRISDCDKKRPLILDVQKKKVELDALKGRRGTEDKKQEDDAWETLKVQQTQANSEIDALTKLIESNEEASKSMIAEINSIREQLKALSEKWLQQQQALTNKKASDNKARKLQAEQQRAEREARIVEMKKRQEEKARQAALILPYEHELEVAQGLIVHLQSLSKAKKNDKISHPIRVYAAFEILAITPPISPAEVEKCLATVQAKCAHYKSLRKAEKEKRALAEKQRLEAEKAAATDAASAPAAAAPPAEQTADAASSTTEEAPAASADQAATEPQPEQAQADDPPAADEANTDEN